MDVVPGALGAKLCRFDTGWGDSCHILRPGRRVRRCGDSKSLNERKRNFHLQVITGSTQYLASDQTRILKLSVPVVESGF